MLENLIGDDPHQADGRVYVTQIYPVDLFGDPERYIICFTPCTPSQAQNSPVVLFPLVPGAYDGWDGSREVSVRMMFSADCFQPRSVCIAHRPYIFDELSSAPRTETAE